MHLLRAAVFAALFFAVTAGHARAQDVTLRSRDGSIEITGNLLGFNGEFYRVETRFGELTVDGSGVICTGVGCPSLTDYVARLRISGSATMGRVLVPALVEAFALRANLSAERVPEGGDHFRYRLSASDTGKLVGDFAFRLGTTEEGFADLLAGDADIVMALREIRKSEAEAAEQAGLGDLTRARSARVLALDALVPVVAAQNPVNAVTLADLSKVLTGETTLWPALGGADAPLTLHLPHPGAGQAQTLNERLLNPARESLSDAARRHKDNAALTQAVGNDPFGLGIASFAEIGLTKPLTLTGPCGFALRAARRTIKTEDYPLTAPLFLYVPERRLPALARDFLRFSASPPAQIIIRRAGFVDLAPEEVPLDLQGDRLANAVAVAKGSDGIETLQRLVETLRPMRRLTTSFRFETGSSKLDAQSRANVRQLAGALEAGNYDSRTMLFVGFSDGIGPSAPNLAIARRRAEATRDAVLAAAETADLTRVQIATEAFGEAMPMACDDTAWGRGVNRRVEVWVR